MLTPCEIAVKSVLPVVRAMLAKQLRQKYNLKQKEIGNLLGITQAAVSQYMRKVRGIALDLNNDKEICKLVDKIATNLYEKKLSTPESVYLLCNICEVVRRKGMMCKLHKRFETNFVTKDCKICFIPKKGRDHHRKNI